MNNEEKTGTINELYGSVQGIHNYVEIYYYQQAREIAAVTAIAMLRDNVPPADVRICIDNWYGVEIPEHAMKILEAVGVKKEELERTYQKLIESQIYYELVKRGKIKLEDKNVVIKYKNYDYKDMFKK